MSYQVLARKWRPQRFDDVLGQQAVTRTLKNALKTGRIAHAFVFAGPRGSGKTTTARILARALNCVKGPAAGPCGVCEACVEIAEGRDMDVLEIDAATHTGVDNVREVIIEGLSITPVRNRYKIFLIDEVHMLSGSSFNALLKSIEEPPPHVVFMMATTELEKIPDTVRSRAQVYEFRTISPKTVAERLRHIAGEEGMQIPDEGLLLLARAGEGSMRDSLSALDQVRAFAGDTITVEDIVTVLGLVGRDLVLDTLEAVVAEDAPAAFALVERAIERGYELRLFCRELARATRDLLILSVDPARASDVDVAAEGDRDRLKALAARCSREDLLRAFDVLARAEQEIKVSEQPRYNLEMILLRLMHLRKLVPLADLIAQTDRPGPMAPARPAVPPARMTPVPARPLIAPPPAAVPRPQPAPQQEVRRAPGGLEKEAAGGDLKDQFLASVKAAKVFFYNTVVAQAYRVEVTPARITFTFLPNQKVPKQQCEQDRAWLESLTEKIAGRKIPVTVTVADTPAAPAAAPARGASTAAATPAEDDLRAAALSDPGVQALFEVFPIEKSKIDEI